MPKQCQDILRYFAEQGSPISTKNLQSGVEMAHHALILRQHGATACTELLEPYFLQNRIISDQCLMEIIAFAIINNQ